MRKTLQYPIGILSKSFYLLIFMIMGSVAVTAQVDCSTVMACNDGIQVSLDENCSAVITADMMMEEPAYGEEAYNIVIMTLDGEELPDNTVNGDHIGMTLQVSVELIGCDNSCWGHINIEDKLEPEIECSDVVVSCTADTDPSASVPRPSVINPCGGPVDYAYSDTTEDMPCADEFGRIITRTWIVTDDSGNSSSCIQTISVMRATLDDVIFPESRDDIEGPSISCSASFPTTNQGNPHPDYTGYPSNVDCHNIQFYYTDVRFPICGGAYKVMRQWTVLDWCTGMEVTDFQVIKVEDKVAPTCGSMPLTTIPTDPEECTAYYTVPAPNATDACSEFTYTVTYVSLDENGDPVGSPVAASLVNGSYVIPELALGLTEIYYDIADECGNERECSRQVLVEDTEAPNAICEGYTVVSLDDQGHGKIFATALDDHSYDNCTPVTLQIARYDETMNNCGHPEDFEFGEFVHLCCADVAVSPIKVILRVTDEYGNYNQCVANVNVHDKYPPVITCPDPVTLECGQDYEDMSLTGGMATATDNCGVEVEFLGYNTNNLNDCGLGYVLKRFSVTDPQGRTATCSQRVNIVNSNPFNYYGDDIEWPANVQVSSCDMDDLEPDVTGWPGISNDACARIAISHSDQVFQVDGDVCLKILRTWRVLNECDVNITSNSYYEHIQKIEVINGEAPIFTEGCSSQTVVAEDGNCDAYVAISVDAEDDCTPRHRLEFSYTIDYDTNGSIDETGDGTDASRVFPIGRHRVVFTVMDQCENTRTCTSNITVRDDKAPTPICLGSVTWGLDENGEAEVWASDFNHKSEDECDGFNLTYSFNAEGTQSALSFTCADVPNGMAAEIPLQMYVFDQSGNSDFCSVVLVLQDSPLNNACDDDGSLGMIEGRIFNANDEGLSSIAIELHEESDMQSTATDDTGLYAFEQLPYFDGYMVKPHAASDFSNGVSTLDLVLIQRHILGFQELSGAHNLIAADINGSSAISSSDIVELRKVILGVKESFSNNTSWKFIPTDFEFEDPAFPWTFPTEVELDELLVDKHNVNFYGIKIGDVNGTATQLQGAGETEDRSNGLTLAVEAAELKAGQSVSLPLAVTEASTIEGAQFTVAFDATALTYVGIENGKASLSAANINSRLAERGLLAISYDQVMGLELDAEDIFMSLQFKVNNNVNVADAISINSDLLRAESYDLSHSAGSITLEVRSQDTEEILPIMNITNTPNPFVDATNIVFNIVEDQEATLRVMDMSGKVVYELTDMYTKGTKEVRITRDQLSTDGVYYYQLEANGMTQVGKMIMIK